MSRKYQPTLRYKKRCEVCGKWFIAHAVNRKYHSKACLKIAQTISRRKQQKRDKEERAKKRGEVSVKEEFDPRSVTDNPSLYWEILNRDGFKCQYCGRNPTRDGVRLEIDHIKSWKDGGKSKKDNLVTACEYCNGCKGSRPLRNEQEFKKRLKNKNKGASATQTTFQFFTKGWYR